MKRFLSLLLFLAVLAAAAFLGYRYLGPVLAEKLALSAQSAPQSSSLPESEASLPAESEESPLSSYIQFLPQDLRQKAEDTLANVAPEDQERALKLLLENISVSDLPELMEAAQSGNAESLKDYALSHFSSEELEELKGLLEKYS